MLFCAAAEYKSQKLVAYFLHLSSPKSGNGQGPNVYHWRVFTCTIGEKRGLFTPFLPSAK